MELTYLDFLSNFVNTTFYNFFPKRRQLMTDKQKLFVDKEKIATAIRLGVPISITSYTLPKEIEAYINSVISEFLNQLHCADIIDYIIYFINELTTNAKKANTKRAYFKEKGLDIKNPQDYDFGMKNFKESTLSNISYYLGLQKKMGLYVKVSLLVKKENVIIEVANNSQLTKQEFKRIFNKLVRARQFSSLDEAVTQVMDESEGAGLGLVVMVLMLKKMGLDERAYQIDVVDGVTLNRVIIPCNLEIKKHAEPLAKTIVEYIDNIPQFPENILQIQKAIDNPDTTMQEIAQRISSDIGLSTNLLRSVNSASFGLSKKCIEISEAVKMMGLRGIQNMLYYLGTAQILETNKEEQKAIWEDSYKLAFFSLNAAKIIGKKEIINDAYICGLLRNIGKIVICLMDPELLAKVNEFQNNYNIPPQVMNMIMSEISQQAEIGALLAEKWNFPKSIVETIRYQNNFEDASNEYKELTSVICFADLMLNFLNGKIEYYQVPAYLSLKFKIKTEEEFVKLCNYFNKKFYSV